MARAEAERGRSWGTEDGASSLIADSEWQHCRFRYDNTTCTHFTGRHSITINTQCMKAFALSRSLAIFGTFFNGKRKEGGQL